MMASRPTVRVKVSPKFPAQVIAGDGITIEQSGGVYTFSSTGSMAGPNGSPDRAVAVFDGVTGQQLDETSATISEGGTLAINPTAATVNRGLVVNQSSPPTGSTQGEFNFNEINVTSGVQVLPATPSTQVPFADQVAAGLKITMNELANAAGFQIPLLVRLNHNAPTDIWLPGPFGADHIGIAVQVHSDAADTSASGAGAGIYGLSTATYLDGGAVHSNAVGHELEVGTWTGATVQYRAGLRLHSHGEVNGLVSDSAITVVNTMGAVPIGWGNFVTFGEFGEPQSIKSTGVLFKSLQSMTIASVFDMSNVTVTGNILNFAGARLTGGGTLVLNKNTTAIASLDVPVFAGTNALRAVGSDNTAAVLDSYTAGAGASAVPVFTGVRSRGTMAARTATQSGDALVTFAGGGYGTAQTDFLAGISAFAAENFTGSAHGAHLTFFTTPIGSTTPVTRARISAPGTLTVSQNATAIGSLPTPASGVLFNAVAPTSTLAVMQIETFGSTGVESPTFVGVRSRGTAASRSAVQANDALGVFGGAGFDSSVYSSAHAGITAFASQTWTGSAHGAYLTLFSTADGSTTATTRGAVEQDGGLTWPRSVTGGSKGSGTINATQIYEANARVATQAGTLAQFAATTSAQFAGLISDETGSGALVFAVSPTLVAPILGIPASGTLTNCTGLPISTGISGLGTGVAAFLATPSSANLASAVTDETGSGALVFGTSPTFTTQITAPVIIGGSTASSTLTLRSTSGTGTSDAIIFQTGSQVERGRVNTSGQWQLGLNTTPSSGVLMQMSSNSTALPTADSGTILHVGAANEGVTRVLLDAIGSNAPPTEPSAAVTYRRARGTAASLSAVQSGDILGSNFAKGRGNAGAYLDNAGAGFVMRATENYTTNGGAAIDFYTTTNGTNVTSAKATLDGLGSWAINKTTAIPGGGAAATGLMFSTTSNFGMFFGSGAPSLSAAKGSLYLRSDGSATNNRAYINTDGSTTWTALTTAA